MASIKIAGVVNDSIVDGEGFRFTILHRVVIIIAPNVKIHKHMM